MRLLRNAAESLRGSLRQINDYWFGYGSPVSLGVIRILLGIAVFFNLLITFGEFSDWYTERGFVPQSAAHQYMPALSRGFTFFGDRELPFEIPRLNLLSHVASSSITYWFYVVTLLACVTMTIGFWTRVSSIVLAIGMVSLHHRNGMILHGGDTLQRVMVLYLALSPCGRACSLDRLIALYRGKIKPGPVLVSLWPQRLITYNLALIYFTTVWHKWRGDQWRSGIATYFPARLNEFKRFPVPSFLNELPFVKFTTYGTLLTELALATLVFYKPFRKWVLLAGLMMHGFIEYSMNIPLFSFTICSLYVTFFEGEEVTAWAKRMGERLRRFSIDVLLPRGMRMKTASVAALEAADPFDLVSYQAGSSESWQARDVKGKERKPFRDSRLRSPGAWMTYPVPGLWRSMLENGIEPIPEPQQSDPAESKRKVKAKG